MTGNITISELHIFPLKSAGGVSVQEANLTEKGLFGDRCLMLVDSQTREPITQRKNPEIARICTKFDSTNGGSVEFSLPGSTMSNLSALFNEISGEKVKAILWGQNVDVLSASSEASLWMSEALKREVNLVFQPQESFVPTEAAYSPMGKSSLSDGYPVLVTFEQSLEALNAKLKEQGIDPLDMNRFRANVVLSAPNIPAWEEYNLKEIQLGGVRLDLVKPSKRCVATGVDQETGEKKGTKHLAVLAQVSGGIFVASQGAFFGMNAVPSVLGHVKVGDPVTILTRGTAPNFALKGVGA